MNNQWYDAETLPPKGTPVNVMIQDVCGGIPRNRYHLEIAYVTDNMCFKDYWSTKSGIVKYWQLIDLPNGFKQVCTEFYKLGEKYEQQ